MVAWNWMAFIPQLFHFGFWLVALIYILSQRGDHSPAKRRAVIAVCMKAAVAIGHGILIFMLVRGSSPSSVASASTFVSLLLTAGGLTADAILVSAVLVGRTANSDATVDAPFRSVDSSSDGNPYQPPMR